MFFHDFQSCIVLCLPRVASSGEVRDKLVLSVYGGRFSFLWLVCHAVVADCREIDLFSLSFQTTWWLYSRELFLSFIVPCTWMPAWYSSDYFESLLLPQWSLNRPAVNAVQWRHWPSPTRIIIHNYANVWAINQSKSLPGFRVVTTSLGGITGRSIQTLLRGENDSKQSDEIQATWMQVHMQNSWKDKGKFPWEHHVVWIGKSKCAS